VPATDSRISYSNGRFFTPAGEAEVRFDWIASQVSLSFSGSASVSALLTSRGAFDVTVDGGAPKLLACGTAERYVLASGLDMHATHNVTLQLRTEAKVSNRTTPLGSTPTRFKGFVLESGATVLPTAERFVGKLVVVGDSITAGWGNTGKCCGQPGARSEPCAEDGTKSYGALVGRDLNLEVNLLASGGSGFGTGGNQKGNRTGVDWTEPSMDRAIFGQLQFDTSAGATDLSAFVPDYLVVNIGTNDSPRLGTAWETIYVGVLKRLRAAWGAKTWFLLGCAPWSAYNPEVESVIETFDDPANKTARLDWGNFTAVARGCFRHPSIAGHRTMADAVLAAIEALPPSRESAARRGR
jgi:lysophospholipase L1-like esterase